MIWYALRKRGVPEYLVQSVMSLYNGCRTAVSVDGKLSDSFFVQVGVHQGSVLSPLLFIVVMDVLTECVRDGSLMELLYADDLVLCGESVEEAMKKYGRWKKALEEERFEGKCWKNEGYATSEGQKENNCKD